MAAIDDDGGRVLVGGPGTARLVLFSSPSCSICKEVAPGIGAAASTAGLTPMILHDPDLERVYDVPGTPFLLVMDASGVVRSAWRRSRPRRYSTVPVIATGSPAASGIEAIR